MLGRYHCMKIVLGAVVANISYKRWLDKQDEATKKKAAWVALTVNDNEHWDSVSRAVRVLTPTLRVLRLTDGKTGATLGKVYGLCAELDALYRNDIDGMDGQIRERMHMLFWARWTYFHTEAFTLAKVLDSEFIKDELTSKEDEEFRDGLKKIALTPNCRWTYTELLGQYAELRTALRTKSYDLNDTVAFSEKGCSMASFEWARTFLYKWKGIQWVVMRMTALACSVSGCEHSWPIEGRIH